MNQIPQVTEPFVFPRNGASARDHIPLTVQSFGVTDRGKLRGTNEDQFVTAVLMKALWIEQSSVVQPPVHYAKHRSHVFIVADGMGGASGGEQASAIAVGAMEEFLLNALRWLLTLDGSEDDNVLREFKSAVRNADQCVYSAAANNPGLRGMGTTLTMGFSSGSELFIAHVGDSRVYLHRGGKLYRLTRDHTLVQQLVEKGLVESDKASEHELGHVITNVVGGPTPGVHTELHRIGLECGDVVLLCTDGLTGMVPDARIASVLGASVTPVAACTELVRLANEAGGVDNITAVVARYI